MRVIVVSLIATLAAAPAGASAEAERYRLAQELEKLAQRNTWTGVERTYLALVALGVPLGPSEHLLGSQAATQRGDTLVAMDRLALAVAAGTDAAADPVWQQAKETLEALQARFGKVDIVVVPPRFAALVRYDPPFAAQEREAIEVAREQLRTTQVFKGLLPIGKYMVDGLVFTVEPNAELLQVKVAP